MRNQYFKTVPTGRDKSTKESTEEDPGWGVPALIWATIGTVRLRMPCVRNHSVMNWAESAKWSNTHEGKLGGSSRKDDGWSREAVDKKTLYEVKQRPTPQKILGILLKARLGSFFWLRSVYHRTCDLFADLF